MSRYADLEGFYVSCDYHHENNFTIHQIVNDEVSGITRGKSIDIRRNEDGEFILIDAHGEAEDFFKDFKEQIGEEFYDNVLTPALEALYVKNQELQSNSDYHSPELAYSLGNKNTNSFILRENNQLVGNKLDPGDDYIDLAEENYDEIQNTSTLSGDRLNRVTVDDEGQVNVEELGVVEETDQGMQVTPTPEPEAEKCEPEQSEDDNRRPPKGEENELSCDVDVDNEFEAPPPMPGAPGPGDSGTRFEIITKEGEQHGTIN